MSRDVPQLTQRKPKNEKRLSWQIITPKATKTTSTDEWTLSEASYPSLLKKKKERLEELCAERDLLVINEHGYSKREMILLLLRWRDTQFGTPPNEEIQRNTPRPRPARPSHPPDLPLLSDPAFLLQDPHISSDEPERKDPFTPSPTPTPPNVDESLPEAVLDLDALNMASKRISPTKLQKGKKIGSGGFKDVYKGKYGKYRVAIADLRATRLTKGDIQELGLLRDFNHENILRFIGVCIPTDPSIPVQIVTELALNGDLFKYIRTVPAPPLLAMLELMLGCAKGLNYLHTRQPPVVHRDIKSLNVLISSRGIPKINDFGLARVKNTIASMCQTSVGTLNWQAPELWVAEPSYTFSIDVYAMGLTYWELLNWWNADKTYPFHGMNEHAIYLEVGKNKLRPSTSALRKRYGFIVINVVHAMWSQKPEERPKMSEVVEALEWMIVEESANRLSRDPY